MTASQTVPLYNVVFARFSAWAPPLPPKYVVPFEDLIRAHNSNPIFYAYDSQGYIIMNPANRSTAIELADEVCDLAGFLFLF